MEPRPTDLLLEHDAPPGTPLPAPVAAVLARYRFAEPKTAHHNVLALGDDPLARDALRELLPALLEAVARNADPDMALNNFERYAAAVASRNAFFSLLRTNPALIEMLAAVFATSQVLSDALVRDPGCLDLIVQPELRDAPRTREALVAELRHGVFLFDGETDRMNAVRRFKRREMLRLGARDILGLADLVTTTRGLSALAAACVEVALEAVLQSTTARLGTPMGHTSGRPVEFAVIGMGKAGAGELNYSSDIDVMLVTSEDGVTVPPEDRPAARAGLDAETFFTKVAEQLIRYLSANTGEGHVFRVDTRLRPEGGMGPLVRPLASYELYYTQWGATWERQALIKARPMAGSAALGRRFVQMVRPFVYRRHLTHGDIEEVRQIKRRADGEVARRGEVLTNVKLGHGGIREAEFTAQLLQLMLGGQYPQLQTPATLEALGLLGQLGFLDQDEAKRLADAYRFLRTVEHRLQLEHAVQTHTIPTEPKALYCLARRCFFDDEGEAATVARFERELARHVKAIAATYRNLLSETQDRLAPKAATEQLEHVDDAAVLLDAAAAPEAVEAAARRTGLDDAARTTRLLHALAYGPPYSPHHAGTTRAFQCIAPDVLDLLSEVPDPYEALANLETFVAAYGARRVLYDLFAANTETLRMLLLLFGTSQFLADILCRQPELFDAAVRRDVIEVSAVNPFDAVYEELPLEAMSVDEALPYFIRYRNEELFKIGLRDVLRLADVRETMRAMSELARRLVALVIDRCITAFRARYGTACNAAGAPARFAVIGLGKLGGDELGYGSDLDVLFVCDGEGGTAGGERSVSAAQYFGELAAAVLRTMTMATPHGSLAKVDARIRPEGEQGPLCPTIEGYANAYRRRIQPWEKQALLRAAYVAGDRSLADEFLSMRDEAVFAAPLTIEELNEIARIRERMAAERVAASERDRDLKLSHGGIVEIEFAAQVLALACGRADRSLVEPNTARQLAALHEAGRLNRDDYLFLDSTYTFYRLIENALRIETNVPADALPADEAELRRLLRALRLFRVGPAAFLERLAAYRRRIRALYERALDYARQTAAPG
ncbi:MAG: bifunctional [glutamate--ammonia ligase]-adenylyl-L-tyrosine phosphorylase/[glutamate--ammonia-ligase] adenylyltransferase [Verrucomicrobia bacterium]|nr:bifunctional [glutamate--ammonia ligase]-adenylyl-L-tyrosine phosphorylase/[glutamate--ammonia-ligase] adenylyltransferase [Verrucomicrobiota bacterium]